MIFCTDDEMHCFLHWLSNLNANENIEEQTEGGFVQNIKECMNSIKYIQENCNNIVFFTARVFSLIKKLIPYQYLTVIKSPIWYAFRNATESNTV